MKVPVSASTSRRSLPSPPAPDHPRDATCIDCPHPLFSEVARGLLALGLPPPSSAVIDGRKRVTRQGDTGAQLHGICQGWVKLAQQDSQGLHRTIRLLSTGSVWGLELLHGEPHHHEATTLVATRVCRVPTSSIARLTVHRPSVHQLLTRQWQATLQGADAAILDLCTGSARQRVARLLLRLAQAQGGTDCPSIPRDDMASLLGLTTETASRTMAAFKREGLTREVQGVVLCQMGGLQAVVNPPVRAPQA